MPARSRIYRVPVLLTFLASIVNAQQINGPRELWTAVRRELSGPDGEQYFQSSMKDTMLPPLIGKMISARRQGDRVVVGLDLSDARVAEVDLILQGAGTKIPVVYGLPIEFSAVAISFTKDPFLVTFETDEKNILVRPVEGIEPSWYVGPALGKVKAGRYQQNGPPVEFDLPADWTVEGARPVTDGSIVTLSHSRFERARAGVSIARAKMSAAEAANRLSAARSGIVGQRVAFQGYAIRPESVQQRWIGGRQGVTALADYEQNGEKMSESLTWIMTEHSRILFFVQATAYDLPIFQAQFDPIIQSAVIP